MRLNPRPWPRAPVLPIPVESAFERVACDILGPWPVTDSGNRYILVFTDYLTKWVEAFAIPSTEAPLIARIFVDEIVARHGAPKTLIHIHIKTHTCMLERMYAYTRTH